MRGGKIILLGGCVAAGLLAALAMRGRSEMPVKPTAAVAEPVHAEADKWNERAIDSATGQLQTGDIVLRMGLGADSYLLAQLNRKNKNYSHCGIVAIENGKPYVYHSIGGEDNPDERLRRDPAAFYFSDRHNSAIAIVRYELGRDGAERLVAVAREFYKKRPRFDMKFDLATDDKLYCSEFVYKALRLAAKDTAYVSTTQGMAGKYVAIDNLLLNKHAKPVLEIKFKQYLYSRN
jgi:hypothetical protein